MFSQAYIVLFNVSVFSFCSLSIYKHFSTSSSSSSSAPTSQLHTVCTVRICTCSIVYIQSARTLYVNSGVCIRLYLSNDLDCCSGANHYRVFHIHASISYSATSTDALYVNKCEPTEWREYLYLCIYIPISITTETQIIIMMKNIFSILVVYV